jgi:hypothetical protein
MCSMFYILIFLYYRSIFFLMFYEMFIYVIHVERVRVGYVANLCVTYLGTMHLT